MNFLIAVGIGPAQDFIASARRSRDLWFGSWLLSEISKAAALKIHSQKGTLIFPSSVDSENALQPDSNFNVVNKLIAQVDAEDIDKYCAEVYTAMQGRLSVVKDDAFSDLKGLNVHWGEAEEQIKDLIEFYWAAYPFDAQAESYDSARKRVEALLEARKATRNFNQVSWGGPVPKSSLDGLRESVIDESVFDRLSNNNLSERERAEAQKRLRLRYDVRGKERLCGVGLLKRHGKPRKNAQGIDSFFSTSHVAALPLLNRLKDKGAVKDYLIELTRPDLLDIIDEKEIRAFLGHIPRNATLKPHPYFCNESGTLLYDGHLLFKERLREFFPEESKRRRAEKALEDFLEKAFGKGQYPHPYYAILHADGDRMGTVIEEQSKKGYQEHQNLSRHLSEFAGNVKRIVEEDHDGSCVYAGGDDVLALLPLHTALRCARELADEFHRTLKSFKDDRGHTPTLSVGLAVGHHLDPLQDTLILARKAEKVAKQQVAGKNALAITVSKRSGADRTVKGSWSDGATGGALDHRLKRFVFLHLKDELPDGAAYELRDLAIRLKWPKDATEEERDCLLKARRVEAKRILRRKRPHHGKEKSLTDEVLDHLHGLVDRVDEKTWSLEALANEIIVAREFATAIEQAGIKAEEFLADDASDKEAKDGSKVES